MKTSQATLIGSVEYGCMVLMIFQEPQQFKSMTDDINFELVQFECIFVILKQKRSEFKGAITSNIIM